VISLSKNFDRFGLDGSFAFRDDIAIRYASLNTDNPPPVPTAYREIDVAEENVGYLSSYAANHLYSNTKLNFTKLLLTVKPSSSVHILFIKRKLGNRSDNMFVMNRLLLQRQNRRSTYTVCNRRQCFGKCI
jgi:hypothetical protein